MTDSASSEEDFAPLGIDMLTISKTKGSSVMAQKAEQEVSDLHKNLQYINLLNSACEILNRTKNNDNERMKLCLSVIRKSKKTHVNIIEIAQQLHRQAEHLSHFISKDLFVDGTISKDGQLILNGIFFQSAVEKTLRKFIDLYVVCKSCESVEDTFIIKENKLYFVKCEKCKGSRCIGNAIEGYVNKDKAGQKIKNLY